MLFRIEDPAARWHTIVVRADDEPRAREIGDELRREYGGGGDPSELAVEQLLPDGPEGVVIDDPS